MRTSRIGALWRRAAVIISVGAHGVFSVILTRTERRRNKEHLDPHHGAVFLFLVMRGASFCAFLFPFTCPHVNSSVITSLPTPDCQETPAQRLRFSGPESCAARQEEDGSYFCY